MLLLSIGSYGLLHIVSSMCHCCHVPLLLTHVMLYTTPFQLLIFVFQFLLFGLSLRNVDTARQAAYGLHNGTVATLTTICNTGISKLLTTMCTTDNGYITG